MKRGDGWKHMSTVRLQPAGRRLPRPTTVKPCDSCRASLGENYSLCASCTDAIECYWHADWMALLEKEGITAGSEDEKLLAAVIHAEIDTQPWTLVDSAMSFLRCPECGSELGGGLSECGECEFAFGNLWWHDQLAGRQGVMTMNEHALRVGRWILRYRHRHSKAIVAGWSLSMPRVLTGWLPTTAEAQRAKLLINQGRVEEVRAEMADVDRKIVSRESGN